LNFTPSFSPVAAVRCVKGWRNAANTALCLVGVDKRDKLQQAGLLFLVVEVHVALLRLALGFIVLVVDSFEVDAELILQHYPDVSGVEVGLLALREFQGPLRGGQRLRVPLRQD
jgi:hypothetical protein